jgi:hypothetical protein
VTELLDDLRQAATPPPPRNFAPGVVFAGGKPSVVTTPPIEAVETEEEWLEAVRAMGVFIPEDHTLVLVEAAFAGSSAAWHRDPQDKGAKHTAYTAPSNRWSYKFRVVARTARADTDYKAMIEEAARRVRAIKPVKPSSTTSTMVVNLADFQVGKRDILGGTAETIQRSEEAMALVKARIRKLKPAELLIVDNGDSTEGFNSAPNAARVNDLQETEAIRVWRRLFWRWVKELAPLVGDVKVISVPSNHCRNRRGKDALGPISDDWGLEVLAQISDIAAENPAYDHVQFIAPREHEHHVTLTLVGGKVISFAHGHDAGTGDQLTTWAKKQGRREIGVSDIVVVGHFHHLRVTAYGDGQYLFICPTMDPGSSHYTVRSGESSETGVLTFMVDEHGWRDLYVAWAA